MANFSIKADLLKVKGAFVTNLLQSAFASSSVVTCNAIVRANWFNPSFRTPENCAISNAKIVSFIFSEF